MSRHAFYIQDAVRHYTTLFTLPSHTRIITYLYLWSVLGSVPVFLILELNYQNLFTGLMFGFMIATFSLLADLVIWKTLTKRDIIFTLRRCSALSFLMGCLWVTTLIIGSLLGRILQNPSIVIYSFLLGFSTVLSVRFLVFHSLSTLPAWKSIIASILQPLTCYLAAAIFLGALTRASNLFAVALISLILLLSTYGFSKIIDYHGKKEVGTGAVSLLKAFLAAWIADVNTPLENFFEKLSYTDDISITTIGFRETDKLKAIMVIPAFHPGPFRKVGSSTLSFRIQETLEREQGAIVCVPHGTSGHELDIASEIEAEKVLKKSLELSQFKRFTVKATKLIRVEVNATKATCQIFGDCALITLTCAPRNMEDIPREIGTKIVSKGKGAKLNTVAVIDAHNSIKEGGLLSREDFQNLLKAAEQALSSALKEHRERFSVGAARVYPQEFSLIQGMGPGGITALVVKVGAQKTAYVVIDANNMVAGLREKILSALKELGIDDGEVLTTDTHMVNGVTLVERGYHPLGEVIEHEKIVEYSKDAVRRALLQVVEAEVAWNTGVVYHVKVIGPKHLKKLSMLVNSTIRLAKRAALMIFPLAIALSIILLALF